MGGFTIKNLDLSALTDLQARLPSTASRVEHTVANQIAKDTQRYVPFSGSPGGLRSQTKVKDNMIIYPGPYARYLYYGKVMVDAVTGRGPMYFKDENGNWLIRFHKGARLKATARDLKLDHEGVDPEAQAHWFEVSKAQNLDKWLDVARKAVARELNK